MQDKIELFRKIVVCIFLLFLNHKFVSSAFAEESLKYELKNELKKGNFLIGLKQYLGGKNDTFSKTNKIKFTTDEGLLNLQSFNGIKHKAKSINIIWKDKPINTPYEKKRIVFGPYASFESAKKQAHILREKGFNASVAYPKNWEVWIPFQKHLPKELTKYEIFKKFYKTQITPFLKDEFSSYKLEGPIYISSAEDIKINSINFGKEFYLVKDSYGTWTLIQKINFDDYLAGVLPYEIGANSPLEALKAQAVIARTWGIFNSERFNMDKYHLCITTQCQVYKPNASKNEKVQKAIKETTNIIITYQNKPINSFYHGSNGGISGKSSESWKIEDAPYLKTNIDGKDLSRKTFKFPIYNDSDLNQFLELEKKYFYGSKHSLFRWNKKISSNKIIDNLIKSKIINGVDNQLHLKVIERGLSGRVTKLKITMTNSNENKVLIKDDIRRVLTFLPSNLFTINKLNNDLWLFKGGGFGHGVGLSQSGAIEMAELGFTYEQILNHYYQGTKLKKIEILSE